VEDALGGGGGESVARESLKLVSNPFPSSKLPPGWTACPQDFPGVWSIRDGQGREVCQHWPDRNFPPEITLKGLWWNYLFTDRYPTMYLRHGSDAWDWLPAGLLPPGVKSLDEIGSLGG
jgi:hypothetical protein